MNIHHTLKIAVSGVTTHKSRSALTILGIVIGITGIMLMVSIGSGAENLILGEIGGLGAETIIIRPGREPSGPSDVGATLFADSLKSRDVELLRRKSNVPDLVDIMPILIIPGSVAYKNETYSPQIFGGSIEFFANAFNLALEAGSFFDDADIREKASVAVIGSKVKDELFGPSDAVGESITIKNKKFRVQGVLAKRGQASFVNFDEVVLVPYTTAQTYLLGTDYYHEVMVKASSPEAVGRAVQDIEATLRESHNITDPDKDDFFVVTQQGAIDQIKTIINALTTFLSSVVAIALVVGGIGVMNIMLVSVTERTREIGLRKALGATNKDILRQFLLEAVILTGVGGLIGIALGAVFGFVASIILTEYANLDWDFVFPISAAILGITVSALVGLVFGIYPASQAAKKSPMEALRYE
ncbi:MAG: ABC transporter permease [Candidatus Liptonbacteria bacterium]|nr:ABC transporter permease [Candidatus Liptonbacteria bacterium]